MREVDVRLTGWPIADEDIRLEPLCIQPFSYSRMILDKGFALMPELDYVRLYSLSG
jgi:hypothetical protein